MRFKKNENGNISITVLVFMIFICFFLIIILDFSCIFVKREKTENVAEMLSLAISQELLSFKHNDINIEDILSAEYKNIENYEIDINISYDEVIVTAKAPLNLLFADKLLKKNSISSTATSKIIYPWSEDFDFCKRYRFSF